jgi:hypothetical protein
MLRIITFSLNPLAVVRKSCFKATRELQMNGLSEVFWKSVYTLHEALEKKVICSHAILEKKLNTTA